MPDDYKLWPDWLQRMDTLVGDEAVVETVAQVLEGRWPRSQRRGRPTARHILMTRYAKE